MTMTLRQKGELLTEKMRKGMLTPRMPKERRSRKRR